MNNADLINEAKSYLRISTTSVDEEIEQTINACLADLSNAGIKKIDTDDALIRQAIKLYLKSMFGYDKEAERYAKAYEYLKISLNLSSSYNAESEV